MRKIIKLLAIVLVIFIVMTAIIQYIKPEQKLNMDYTPIAIDALLLQMVKEFKSEIRLSRSNINALIKHSVDQELHPQVYVDGADFHMENSLLHGRLNVTIANRIKAELTVIYSMRWEQPNVILEPYSLHTKSIPLPIKSLQRIDIPLASNENSFVKIKDIYNDGQDIVIALQVQLF